MQATEYASAPAMQKAQTLSQQEVIGYMRESEQLSLKDPQDLRNVIVQLGTSPEQTVPQVMVIHAQEPQATEVKTKEQWAKEGRTVNPNAQSISIIGRAVQEHNATSYECSDGYDVSQTAPDPNAIQPATYTPLEYMHAAAGAADLNLNEIAINAKASPKDKLRTVLNAIAAKIAGAKHISEPPVDHAAKQQALNLALNGYCGLDTAQAPTQYITQWAKNLAANPAPGRVQNMLCDVRSMMGSFINDLAQLLITNQEMQLHQDKDAKMLQKAIHKAFSKVKSPKTVMARIQKPSLTFAEHTKSAKLLWHAGKTKANFRKNPQSFRQFLDLAVSQPNMRVENLILLQNQNPAATMLHTAEEWNAMGRHLAPDARPISLFTVNPTHPTSGKIAIPIKCNEFYDVSQTEGRPIAPLNRVNAINQSGDLTGQAVQALQDAAQALGAKTDLLAVPGDYNKIKTVADHILASYSTDQKTLEPRAQTASYIIGKELGLNTASYPIQNAAAWAKSASLADLQTVTRVSKGIARETMRQLDRAQMHELTQPLVSTDTQTQATPQTARRIEPKVHTGQKHAGTER